MKNKKQKWTFFLIVYLYEREIVYKHFSTREKRRKKIDQVKRLAKELNCADGLDIDFAEWRIDT